MTTDLKRTKIAGRGIPLPGNDIDTDRIIPARFLKEVTFETMGEHAFEDAKKQNPEHPFNSPVYKGAAVMVVGQNFGCGSSREHAPQALMRWGIQAIVGGSFGEIFFGNCVMLGIPCLVASQADLEWLQKAIGRAPQEAIAVDLEKQEVRFGDRVIKATVPDGRGTSSWGGRGIRRRCCSKRGLPSRRRRGSCRTSQGSDRPPPGFPFAPGVGEFPGTDQIFVGSTQTGFHDGYSGSPRLNGPQVLTLDYSSLVGPGQVLTSLTLGIAADDFQFPVFGQPFTAKVNGVTSTALTSLLNGLSQSGPQVQFVTLGLDPSIDAGSHVLTISIDQGGDGGDGWAVDFLTVGVTTASPNVPEPSTILLVGAGGIGLLWASRRAKR